MPGKKAARKKGVRETAGVDRVFKELPSRDQNISKSNWPELLKQPVENSATVAFDGKEVEVTNVDKKLWGAFTKAHLLSYYHSIYPYIIPHLKDRPLSLHIKHI